MNKKTLTFSVIRDVARKHIQLIDSGPDLCSTPQSYANSGTADDTFVILKNPPCRFNTVSLDHKGLMDLPPEKRWLVLYLYDSALYLVERQECLTHCRLVDGSLLLDLKSVIQLPVEDDEQQQQPQQPNMEAQIAHERTKSSVVIDAAKERNPFTTVSYAPHPQFYGSGRQYYEKTRYDEPVMRKTLTKYATRITLNYTLFSLPGFLCDETDGMERPAHDDERARTHMDSYMLYVCGYTLIHTQFKHADHRHAMENKLLAYYQSHGGGSGFLSTHDQHTGHPHSLMVHCMLNMIHCESATAIQTPLFQKSSVRYVELSELRCKLLDECIAWEMFKLSRSATPIPVRQYARLVVEHCAHMREMHRLHDFPLPRWMAYRVQRCDDYWVAEPVVPNEGVNQESDLLYSVAFEWLPVLTAAARGNASLVPTSANSVPTGMRIRKGRVTLSYTVFHDVFLPCLYRQTLLDAFRLALICRLRLSAHGETNSALFKEWRLYSWFDAEIYQRVPAYPLPDPSLSSSSYVVTSPLTSSNNTTSSYATDLCNYNCDYLDPDSPVTRKLLKRDNYMDLDNPDRQRDTGKSRSTSQQQQQLLRPIASLVDIEDLNTHLPPCLKPVLSPDVHLKYMDRYSIVNYLIDADFQLEQILSHLRSNDRRELTAIYKQQIIKKRAAPGRMLSLTCGGQMSLDASFGNTTRCPYEARCHGEQRKRPEEYDSLEEKLNEQNGFKHQCSTLAFGLMQPPRISHPLDFVRAKLERAKQT
jgi:hypothetical protein